MRTVADLDHASRCRDAMAQRVARWTVGRSDCMTAIPGLGLFRRDVPMPPAYCMIQPSIVVVVQGAKQMWIADRAYRYDVSQFLVTSLDLPGRSEVIEASPEAPCLGLFLTIDTAILAELIARGTTLSPHAPTPAASVGLDAATPVILDPLARLVALLDEPESIEVIAPLIQREIHFRLLQSRQAARLRQIASVDSHGFRVARAIDWLKSHYRESIRIEQLATEARMSAPTFHHHFRALTTMSPLQYQKQLRLDEARRLMLQERLDASSAAYRVGYESPSQFSREYRRTFGAPPVRDISRLRRQTAA